MNKIDSPGHDDDDQEQSHEGKDLILCISKYITSYEKLILKKRLHCQACDDNIAVQRESVDLKWQVGTKLFFHLD